MPPIYQQLKLKHNPFQMLDMTGLMAVTIKHKQLEPYLHTQWNRLELIGDKGTGKSSGLRYLQKYFEQQGLLVSYEHLSKIGQAITTPFNDCDVFILDEAQRAKPRQLKNLFDTAKIVVLGTHQSAQKYMPKDKAMQSIRLERISYAHFRKILDARLQLAKTAESIEWELSDKFLETWLEQSKYNLHLADLLGYDLFQNSANWQSIDHNNLNDLAVQLWPRVEIHIHE